MNREELSDRIDEHSTKIGLLRDLEAHPGWKIVSGYLAQTVVNLRQSFITSDIDTLDRAIKAARDQAALGAAQLAATLPRILREEEEGSLLRYKEELRILQEFEDSEQPDEDE